MKVDAPVFDEQLSEEVAPVSYQLVSELRGEVRDCKRQTKKEHQYTQILQQGKEQAHKMSCKCNNQNTRPVNVATHQAELQLQCLDPGELIEPAKSET